MMTVRITADGRDMFVLRRDRSIALSIFLIFPLLLMGCTEPIEIDY